MQKVFSYLKYAVYIILLTTFISSCSDSRKIAYFSDSSDSTAVPSRSIFEPQIQKKDILSIAISSMSTPADVVFNEPNRPLISSGTQALQTAGYLVGEDGTVRLSQLGEINAEGLTQKQLENNIRRMLIDRKLLLDPIVSIRYINFRVTVLGEVARPGVINVPSEQISILEALGSAGDLTIYGLRDNVLLIRQVGETKITKRLDLNSTSLLSSPYFYLKTNDILYVEPAKTKIAATDRTLQLLPIIFSGLSLLTVLLLRYKQF